MYFAPVSPVDIPQIVQCLQILRTESPVYQRVSDEPNFVASNLEQLISAGHMVGNVAYDGKELVGFMIGYISNQWYSREVECMEQLLYIRPEHRGGMLAVRLIKRFVQTARLRGASRIFVGASTGMEETRTVQMYERLGWTKHSPSLCMEL